MFNTDTIIFVDDGIVHEIYDSYIKETVKGKGKLIRLICSADGWFVEVERAFGTRVENLAAIQDILERIREARKGNVQEGVMHIDKIKKALEKTDP